MDLRHYRTNSEREYVQNIANIPAATLWGWRDKFEVSNDAMCFTRPLLTVDFLFVWKNSTYWRPPQDESRDRHKTGFRIPYQCSAHR